MPSVLSYSSEANIEPSLEALQHRLDLTDADLRKIVVRLPAVLGLRFDANIDPKLGTSTATGPERPGAQEDYLRNVDGAQ